MEDFEKNSYSAGNRESWNAGGRGEPDPWSESFALDSSEPVPAEAPAFDRGGAGDRRERAARQSGRRVRRRRRVRHRWGGFLSFVAGLAVAGGLAFGARYWNGHFRGQSGDPFLWDYREQFAEEWGEAMGVYLPTWSSGQGASFQVALEHGEARTAQEIYRQVNPSVVTVLVDLGDETAAVGTGVIFTGDGYFVTNYHVVEGGTECMAVLDSGRNYAALYVAGDEAHDLAVLKMDCQEELPAAEFGDSDLLSVGDPVYAIGNPLGVEFRGTLTDGIISATSRNVEVDGRSMTLVQTNAALNSGNSGGPLINEYGQVVGINVVKMSSSRSTVEGLGFAIPTSTMDRLVNDLLTYGEIQPEPLLGVTVSSLGTEVAEGMWGIEVLEVSPGSAADVAGIQAGDYIVYAGDSEITTSQELLRIRRRYYVGDELPMTIWRDGWRMDLTLVLAQ